MPADAQTWIQNLLSRGASGAGIGTLAGTGIGTLAGTGIGLGVGALESLFGDDGGDEVERQRKMWEDLAYEDPNKDPRYKQSMDQLSQWSHGGLTAQDKAMMLRAITDAGAFAKGREGAIEQDAAMRGDGGNAGMTYLAKQLSGQGAAGRVAEAGSGANAMADARARQAGEAFRAEMDKNAAQLNNFKIMKTQGMNNAAGNAQDFAERQREATRMAISGVANGIGQIAAGAREQPPTTFSMLPTGPVTHHDATGAGVPKITQLPEVSGVPPAPTAASVAAMLRAPSSLILNGGRGIDLSVPVEEERAMPTNGISASELIRRYR